MAEMQKGKRIINVDETWIGEMDFRRLKWRRPGDSNSVSGKDVTPRLSVIAAVDNYGGFYWTVLQAYVDREVFLVFISHLVAKLSAEDPNWRANTVLLLDNAKYHHTEMVRNQLQLQGIDHIFLGPYSFSGAAVEMVFSALKRTHLNSHHLPTGKK